MMSSICPICAFENNHDDQFCRNCSWELIHIPENSNKALRDYYNERLKLHKKMHEKLENISESLEIKDAELLKKKNSMDSLKLELNEHIELVSKQKEKINQFTAIELQLLEYQDRYGDALFSNNSNKDKSKLVINWKIESNSIILSRDSGNVNYMPKKIAVIFNQKPNPLIGKFDFILLGIIKKLGSKYLVDLQSDNLPKGDYYIKPISLDNKNAKIIFICEEKTASPNEYEKSKTKITIK